MDIAISFIAFQTEPVLNPHHIVEHFKNNWSQQPHPIDIQKEANTISFRVGHADVILGIMPAPIPWSELEGPCETSLLWPNATQILKDHKYHVVVTVSGDIEPISLSTLLTQATTSVNSTSTGAVGVYWVNATLVVPKDMFNDFATRVLPLGPPLHIWVDFRVGKDGENTCAGFTTGMEALGHKEFEVIHAPRTVPQLREFLQTLVAYVLENGPVIEDGHTVGNDANEHIRVRYANSTFGNKNQVMRLEFDKKPSAKSWWKRWT